MAIRFLTISCVVFLTLYSPANCAPSKNTDERIVELQQKLLNVQSQILALKVNMETEGNSDVFKGRISALEQSFQQLKEEIDAEQRESSAQDEKYENALATLMAYYKNLDTEIKDLKNKASATSEPSDWDRVEKVVRCIATIIPVPFSIFGSIPCMLSDMV